MSLFRRNRTSISDIDVRLAGWHRSGSNEGLIQYDNENGDVFAINFFNKQPDIGASLADVEGIRTFYREVLVENNMGLLECDVCTVAGLPAVYVLAKLALAPRGFVFLGSYTIPRRDNSFVLRYQAVEEGVTGLREAAVLATLPLPEIDEATNRIVGWCADPYDATLDYPVMRNLADLPEYDAKFPEHPLSRTRKFMAELPQHVTVSQRLQSSAAFAY